MILLNRNLEAFLSVANLKTVSGAAKNLGLTQTAITQRLKLLESDLGITLFLRSKNGMKLTPEGEILLRSCLEAKSIEGRLLAGLQKSGEQENINLCIVGPASIIAGRVTKQCHHIYVNWPKLNIRLLVDVNANRLNHLKRGSADLAILQHHEVADELDSKTLKPLEIALVCKASWKNRTLKEIIESERMLAYHPEDSTGLDYLKTFNMLKLIKRSPIYTNENQALINLLTGGIGFGVLPIELAEPLVKNKQLIYLNHGQVMKIPIALAWYPRKNKPHYFQEIISSIK